MKSKSKDPIKPRPAKKVSLRATLNKNKKITENVKDAAHELTSINKVLNQGIKVNTPVQAIKETITLNKDVEHKVARAADDLLQVNIELTKQVDKRVVIESELTDTKTDLAKVRDDLSKSQAKEEETRKITLHDAMTGLPNRVLFEQHLAQGLIQAKRRDWSSR